MTVSRISVVGPPDNAQEANNHPPAKDGQRRIISRNKEHQDSQGIGAKRTKSAPDALTERLDEPRAALERILDQIPADLCERQPPHALVRRRRVVVRIEPAKPRRRRSEERLVARRRRRRVGVERRRGREVGVLRPHEEGRRGRERRHARGLQRLGQEGRRHFWTHKCAHAHLSDPCSFFLSFSFLSGVD